MSRADGIVNGLNPCGVNNVSDARLVADRLFSATATKLDVPFSLQPDFKNTAFELNYVETLRVEGTDATRTMTTAGTAAVAELYQITGRVKVLVGRYYMPMSATVASAGGQ